MALRVAELQAVITADDSDFRQKTASAGQTVDGLGSKVGGMAKLAGGALLGLGAAGAAGLGQATRSAADFEFQMDAVNASLGGLDTSQMAKVEQQALDLGSSTKFSAQEVGQVQEELARSGISFQDMMDGATQSVLDLSAATGEDLVTSGRAAAGMMNLFGLSGDQMTGVADTITAGLNNSSASLADFQTGVNTLGPVMGNLTRYAGDPVSAFEDTSAAVAYFNSLGLKAADAGVSLARGMTNLADPTSEASQMMANLGISAFDANGNFLPLPDLFDQLQGAMGGMTDQAREQALATIFGAEAADVMNAAIKNGGDPLREYEALMRSNGQAAEQAAIRQDNLTGSVEELGGAIDSAGIAIGKLAIPKLREWVETATTGVNAFTDAFRAGIKAGLNPFHAAGLGVVDALDAMMGGSNGATRAMRNFMDAVAKGAPVFRDMSKSYEMMGDNGLAARIRALGDALLFATGVDLTDFTEGLADFSNAIGDFFQAVGQGDWATVGSMIGDALGNIGETIGNTLGAIDLDEVVVNIGSWALGQIADFAGFLSDVVTGEGSGAGAELHGVLVNIASWALGSVASIGDFLNGLFNGGAGPENGDPNGIGTNREGSGAAGAGANLNGVLVNILSWAAGEIADIGAWIKDTAIPALGQLAADVASVMVNIGTWALGKVQDLGAWFTSTVMPSFGQIAADIAAVMVNVGTWAKGKMEDLGTWIQDVAIPSMGDITAEVPKVLVSIGEWVISPDGLNLSGLWDTITAAWEAPDVNMQADAEKFGQTVGAKVGEWLGNGINAALDALASGSKGGLSHDDIDAGILSGSGAGQTDFINWGDILGSLVDGAVQGFEQAAGPALERLKSSIGPAFEQLKTDVFNWIKADLSKSKLGPSPIWEALDEWLIGGVTESGPAGGADQYGIGTNREMGTEFGGVTDAIVEGVLGKAQEIFEGISSGLQTGLQEMASGIQSALQETAGNFFQMLGDAFNQAFSGDFALDAGSASADPRFGGMVDGSGIVDGLVNSIMTDLQGLPAAIGERLGEIDFSQIRADMEKAVTDGITADPGGALRSQRGAPDSQPLTADFLGDIVDALFGSQTAGAAELSDEAKKTITDFGTTLGKNLGTALTSDEFTTAMETALTDESVGKSFDGLAQAFNDQMIVALEKDMLGAGETEGGTVGTDFATSIANGIASGITAADASLFAPVGTALTTKLNAGIQAAMAEGAVNQGESKLPIEGGGMAATMVNGLVAQLTAGMAGVDPTVFANVGAALMTKLQEGISAALSGGGGNTMGGPGERGGVGGTGQGMAGGIVTSLVTGLSAGIQAADFTAVGIAISTKLNEAISAALSGGGQGNSMGGPGERGEAGAAGGGLGAAIVASLASQIQGADFSPIGTAISTKLNEVMSTALSGGGNSMGGPGERGEAGTASAGIGQSIVTAIVNSVTAADWSGLTTAFETKVQEAMTAFTTAIETGMTEATTAVETGITAMETAFSTLAESATTAGTDAGTGFKDGLQGGLDDAVAAAEEAAGAVSDALATAADGAYDAGVAVGTGFADGIRSQIENVRGAAGDLAAAGQVGIEGPMEIASPSKVTTRLGEFFGAGFIEGILSQVMGAVAAARALAEGAAAGARDGAGGTMTGGGTASGTTMQSIGSQIGQGFWRGMLEETPRTMAAARFIIDQAMKEANNAAQRWSVRAGGHSMMARLFQQQFEDIEDPWADPGRYVDLQLKMQQQQIRAEQAAISATDARARQAEKRLRQAMNRGASKKQIEALRLEAQLLGQLGDAQHAALRAPDGSAAEEIAQLRVRAIRDKLNDLRGLDIGTGISEDIGSGMESAARSTSAATDSMNSDLASVGETAQGVGQTVQDTFSGAGQAAQGAVQGAMDKVHQALGVGQSSMDAVGESANEMLAKMLEAKNATTEMGSAAETAGGQMDEIGKTLGQVGTDAMSMEGAMRQLQSAMNELGSGGFGGGDLFDAGEMADQARIAGERVGTAWGSGLDRSLFSANRTVEAQIAETKRFFNEVAGIGQVTGTKIGTGFANGLASSPAPNAATNLVGRTRNSLLTGGSDAAQSANDAGLRIGNNLSSGISRGGLDAIKSASNVNSRLNNTLNNSFGKINMGTINTDPAINKVSSAIDRIGGMATQAERNANSVGANITAGLKAGLDTESGALYDKVKEIVDKAIQTANKEAQNASPSKRMMEVGEYLAQGLAVGIDHDAKLARKSMGAMIGGLEDEAQKFDTTVGPFGLSTTGGGSRQPAPTVINQTFEIRDARFENPEQFMEFFDARAHESAISLTR